MQFTMTIREGAAAVSGISALICGNSDYRVLIDYDAEWESRVRFLYVEIIRADGSETRFFPVPNNAVNLPAIRGAESLRLWLVGTALGVTVQSGKASLPCEPCITDTQASTFPDYFDVYNAVMQYAADVRAGISAEALEAELDAIRTHTAQPVPDSEYRTAVEADCAESGLSGTVTLPSGAAFTFTEDDILADSFGISANALTDDFLLPGGVPSAELSCTFAGSLAALDLSGASITADYTVQTHLCRRYALLLGTFRVREAQKAGTNQLQITAYDAMMQLDDIPVRELDITADTAYTPQEIIVMIAEKSGIPYTGSTADFVNSSRTFILSALDDTIETLRDLLMYTVQILCCCAFIGRDGGLHLSPVVYTEPSCTAGERQIMQSQVSAKRYQLGKIAAIVQQDADGVRTAKTLHRQTYWADGVSADLAENPLLRTLSTDADFWAIANVMLLNLCDALDFAAYDPAEITQTSDPATELMQWREYVTRSGTVHIPVTAYDWTFHGGISVTASGSEAIAGIQKTQAQKIASGERTSGTVGTITNVRREILLRLLQSHGNAAMEQYSNQVLSHFSYAELLQTAVPMTHAEMAQYTHAQLAELQQGQI